MSASGQSTEREDGMAFEIQKIPVFKREPDIDSDDDANGRDNESDNIVNENNEKHDSQAHRREIEKIIGVTNDNKELEFGIRFKGSEILELLPARIVNLQYPQEVIAYYEDRLAWEFDDGSLVKAIVTKEDSNSVN